MRNVRFGRKREKGITSGPSSYSKKKWAFTKTVSPDPEKIREKAYAIWESKGRPEHNALENWLEAEREVKK